MRILLVEDDNLLSAALSKALRYAGFVVTLACNAEQGLAFSAEAEPDIVILDLGLPDQDGTEVLRQLRSVNSSLPVIILTARDTVYDKVDALDRGADDYLAKPFDMDELLARIRVVARRLGTASTTSISCGQLSMDTASHSAYWAGQSLSFTRKEFLILKVLMQNIGRVQTKSMIEHALYDWREELASNTIEVHMSNLRKKLPENMIKTIRGVGYLIPTASGTREQ